MGTAVHRGIEGILKGEADPWREARLSMERSIENPDLQRTLKMTDGDMIAEVDRLVHKWDTHVAPLVGEPLAVEHHFDIEWHRYFHPRFGEVVIHLTGTIDCVAKTQVWDWKTSGSKYKQWEKQRTAVQPTVYGWAAAQLGFLDMPVDFTFAVLLRGSEDHQLVPVHRTERHMAWLFRLVQPLIDLGLTAEFGTDTPWPLNDTHFLCSEKWCPWWSICKGADLVPSDLRNKE